jgi:hypothetical protein
MNGNAPGARCNQNGSDTEKRVRGGTLKDRERAVARRGPPADPKATFATGGSGEATEHRAFMTWIDPRPTAVKPRAQFRLPSRMAWPAQASLRPA